MLSLCLGWSWECLEEWGLFLRLAIPGIVTIAAEISNFEVGAFVTGSIDSTQQAIYVIIFNIAVISFMVWTIYGVKYINAITDIRSL